MVVPEGVPAIFKCQQRTTSIFWHVNGESMRYHPGNATHILGSRVNGSNIIYTLTIVAELEFNNSVVECKARYVRKIKTVQLVVQGESLTHSFI